ncbi:MAG TPA: transcription termination factor NusA [Hyphomicrobiaceae bacterium]|nr:transcription termination/antitermination protein NusA [Hyphomicrobiaceae bacterium]MCC0009184.1 transcription termination/antitermination protein NusA [Hyphomicrobiaceae bacterium]HRY07923.1 transcription termination factor NusA [Hyphomicrobiaceae bacterium]
MAMPGISANKLELLQIADAVAREKSIDRMIVLQAMEDAIQKAAKSRYGSENDIRCEIDPKTGEAKLSRVLSVVEDVENDSTEISLGDAQARNPNATIGDLIAETLPPLEFGRVAAQNAKQVIVQKVREAERERQYTEYKDRVGEIANGTVKRAEYGNVIVDLGRAEAIIRRDEMIPRENVRLGDRIRAYIYNVERTQRGPQIFLSRARPEFMSKLFAQEVPEIYDGVVQIMSVARDPGSRAKIAVISRDSSIDPVGACVGMRGARVQAVVNELQNEKIDIIQWKEDAAEFIVNALAPAEVTKVVLDEDSNRIEVVVPETQLSLAIGRRGQNVRLASQLTGWDIDILTEEEESERRHKEFTERSQMFMDALDVDEVIAQLLVTEGFATVEEVAYVELDEIAQIEGFDEGTAEEIQSRAREALEKLEAERDARRRELGVEDGVSEIAGVSTAMLVAFGEAEIKTVEDVADCATDDLVGWTERAKEKGAEPVRHKGVLEAFDLSRKEAEDMIMSARVHAGWITAEELEEMKAAEAAKAAEAEAAGTGEVAEADAVGDGQSAPKQDGVGDPAAAAQG